MHCVYAFDGLPCRIGVLHRALTYATVFTGIYIFHFCYFLKSERGDSGQCCPVLQTVSELSLSVPCTLCAVSPVRRGFITGFGKTFTPPVTSSPATEKKTFLSPLLVVTHLRQQRFPKIFFKMATVYDFSDKPQQLLCLFK